MIVEGSKECRRNWRLILTFPLTLFVAGLVFSGGASPETDREGLYILWGSREWQCLYTSVSALIIHLPVALVLGRHLSGLRVPFLVFLSSVAVAVSSFCIFVGVGFFGILLSYLGLEQEWLPLIVFGVLPGLAMSVIHVLVFVFLRSRLKSVRGKVRISRQLSS